MDGSSDLRIDRRRIREAHEARRAEYRETPRPLSIRADVRVLQDHLKEARIGSFVITSDEGPIVGGGGTAPTPLSYFVASLGFAVLTDLVRAFSVFDLPVDELRLEIRADFPLGAKYADAATSVAAERVEYTVHVTSSAPGPAVEEAIRWAERFCHAVHTVREPVPVEAAYRFNGAPVPLAEAAGPAGPA
jgi:uncharacterized OsmC-like protein